MRVLIQRLGLVPDDVVGRLRRTGLTRPGPADPAGLMPGICSPIGAGSAQEVMFHLLVLDILRLAFKQRIQAGNDNQREHGRGD